MHLNEIAILEYNYIDRYKIAFFFAVDDLI